MRKSKHEKIVDQSHEIRELRQINLLMKKLLDEKEETEQRKKLGDVLHQIKELEQLNSIAKKLIDKLISGGKTNLSEEFLTKLNHELRTPMVPIKAYTDMLLDGHFGKITKQQKERIRLIKANVTQMHEALTNVILGKNT